MGRRFMSKAQKSQLKRDIDIEERQLKRESDVKRLMSDQAFRRYFWALLESAGLFRAVRQSNEDQQFDAGRRSVVLPLFAEAQQLAPQDYALMVAERPADLYTEDDGFPDDTGNL